MTFLLDLEPVSTGLAAQNSPRFADLTSLDLKELLRRWRASPAIRGQDACVPQKIAHGAKPFDADD
jgi:hypothetical protein